jgi:hypothetical protein
MVDADPVKRLAMIQERIDLLAELDELQGPDIDITELEAAFVADAAAYSASKNIAYEAWREIGVPPKVLLAGGVLGPRDRGSR